MICIDDNTSNNKVKNILLNKITEGQVSWAHFHAHNRAAAENILGETKTYCVK